MMRHVADVYPEVKELILKSVTPEDQKDHMLRAIANTIRFVLKMINRKDSLQLWQKLHPLFSLKLEVTEGSKTVDPVSVTDI